jgi:flagellar protein FlaG
MGVMNKLGTPGSVLVASITQVHGTGKKQDTAMRQSMAGSGNSLPGLTDGMTAASRREEVVAALQQLAGQVQNISRELNFSVDQDTDRIVVTVLDEATGEVIRQIPSEDMLKLVRQLDDSRERGGKGLLFSEDA